MTRYLPAVDHQKVIHWIVDITSKSKLDLQLHQIDRLLCMQIGGFKSITEQQKLGGSVFLPRRALERANFLLVILTLLEHVSPVHESFYESWRATNVVHWLGGVSIRDHLLESQDDQRFICLIEYLHVVCVGGER